MTHDGTTHDDGTPIEPGFGPDALDALRKGYHAPPTTPRDEMWAVIEARILDAGTEATGEATHAPIDLATRRRRFGPGSWIGGLLAASVVLWMGIGIGRMTAPVGDPTAMDTPTPGASAGVRTAAARHLAETESLLRMVRVDARGGAALDAEVGEWGRNLLTRTRLLLDSGDRLSPEMRVLLEDLELVLVQVSLLADGELSPDRYRGEVDLLEEDLEQQNLFPRIQAVVPEPGIIMTAG